MLLRRLSCCGVSAVGLLAATFFTLAATAADDATTVVSRGGSPTAVAVQTLVQGPPEAALQALPDGFVSTVGYQPIIRDGQLVRPDGDCSSPVPLPPEFERACQQHDLGYDLLRYAGTTGDPLGRWARGDLDDEFAAQIRAACQLRTQRAAADQCRISAELAVAGVEFNSVRQGDGVPEESALTRSALVSSLVALGGVGIAVTQRRP